MFKRIAGRLNLGITIIKGVKNWPRVFMNYFKILNDEYIYFKFRKGGNVKIRNIKNKGDTSGLATIYEIFLMKNYSPKGLKIGQKDIVIDIGANIGVFSLYASMMTRKGKVYSYEPFNAHYKRLQDNIALNNIKNISPFNLAVCKNSGERSLFINKECSGMHSVVFEDNNKEEVKIKCTTLEEIFKKNKIKKCDFLKVDCEGAEYEIIYNTSNKIFDKIDKIALEFDNIDNGKKNCQELKKFLEKRGFKIIIHGAKQHQGILYAKKI